MPIWKSIIDKNNRQSLLVFFFVIGRVSRYGGGKWEMARSRERARSVRSDLTLSYQYRHETAIITHLVIFFIFFFLTENLQD